MNSKNDRYIIRMDIASRNPKLWKDTIYYIGAVTLDDGSVRFIFSKVKNDAGTYKYMASAVDAAREIMHRNIYLDSIQIPNEDILLVEIVEVKEIITRTIIEDGINKEIYYRKETTKDVNSSH